MKPLILFVLGISTVPLCIRPLQAQVTTNVFERVLDVRVNADTPHAETATAFTLDVDGREYLITAKHVVAGLGDEGRIDIFINNNWKQLKVKIFRCADPVDIAVLIPPYQLTVAFPLSINGGVYYGQEAYFLGFPFGIRTPASGVNGPYPIALIKRGTVSSIEKINPVGNATRILLDGYNNPGFSGGPIVYRDMDKPGYVMGVIGVIAGFIPEVVPTMEKHDIPSPADASETAKSQPWRIQHRANGTWFEFVDTDKFVALNTGLVVGFGIQPAIDLIRQHPIGPEAKNIRSNGFIQ